MTAAGALRRSGRAGGDGEQDSNLRRLSQRVYSPLCASQDVRTPRAQAVSPHLTLAQFRSHRWTD